MLAAFAVAKDDAEQGAGQGDRLLSVDALRGAAALAVVLCHSSLTFGYVGVYLFFVISGFCIHLRWASAAARGASASVDFWEFWKRRTLRLYPPYAAAMLLSLLVLAAEGALPRPRFLAFDLALHALMLHNFTEATKQSLNPVFWTLAVEEQLYLAYFLLLALRRRLGWPAILAIALAVRAAWIPVTLVLNAVLARRLPADLLLPMQEGAAWFWFLWVLGALSVEAATGITQVPTWCRRPSVAVAALAAATVLTAARGAASSRAGFLLNFLFHPLWGFAFFVLVNTLWSAERRWRAEGSAPAVTVALARVGLMSYSLYLTHTLVVAHAARWLSVPLRLEGRLALVAILLVPASLAFAWIFFRVVEAPCIRLAKTVGARSRA